jgi:hypothetical protein
MPVQKAIDDLSYVHDFGYMYARLPGSRFEHLARKDWDQIYRNGYTERGYDFVGEVHYAFLRPFGWMAWERNWELMKEWGYETYKDYLDAKTKGRNPCSLRKKS